MSIPIKEEQGDRIRIEDERSPKRLKVDVDRPPNEITSHGVVEMDETQSAANLNVEFGNDLLPPSKSLFFIRPRENPGGEFYLSEVDVGISQYISYGMPPIHGIIKQRYAYNFAVPFSSLLISAQVYRLFGE